MRTARFIASNAQRADSETFILDQTESHHLVNVLRLEPGARVEVYDPDSQRTWSAEYSSIENGCAVLARLAELPAPEPLRVKLLVALSGGALADEIVEKAVELGAGGVIFFPAERSQERLRGDGIKRRLERLRRVAIAALKQSGAARLPEISCLRGISEVFSIAKADAAVKLICAAPEQDSQGPETPELLSFLRSTQDKASSRLERIPQDADFLVMIGPEGGWSAGELSEAAQAGFHPVSLGPNTLRAETAAVAALAVVTAVVRLK